MACELEEAFDRAKSLLPRDWIFIGFSQDRAGWLVSAGKKEHYSQEWSPLLSARAGTFTKALNRLADKLEGHKHGN